MTKLTGSNTNKYLSSAFFFLSFNMQGVPEKMHKVLQTITLKPFVTK